MGLFEYYRRKIKEKSPSAVIVVGGIGTKEAAIAYLQNFAQFDIAMWGEGEIPLLHLTEKFPRIKRMNYPR